MQRLSNLICDNIVTPVSSTFTNTLNTYTSFPDSVSDKSVDVNSANTSNSNTTSSNNTNNNTNYFAHLQFAEQTYWQHFGASMGYSWRSFKSSFYFFCHAFWPDLFQHSGSDTIVSLNDELLEKCEQRIAVIAAKYAT
jgi:hypothetical protein